MYQPTTPGYHKGNIQMQWGFPDRVFFACGACHILAYAFLDRWKLSNARSTWIRPVNGFTGNHIFVEADGWIFDYHGYSPKTRFLDHVWRGARRRWTGWNATLIYLPPDVLVSEVKSRTYEGLWLREPRQFLHDAIPRARNYLNRFPVPSCGAK